MFGILLYTVLLVILSWLIGQPQSNQSVNNSQSSKVYPEDVFKLIDEPQHPNINQCVNYPWTDDVLEVKTNANSQINHVANQPGLLFSPATSARDISVFEHVKQQKYPQIKSICSLLKQYGFISKSQKISGKGVTQKILIQHIKIALQNQNATSLLAGYLKIN